MTGLFAALFASAVLQAPAPAAELAPCTVEGVPRPALCGTLLVPEDHARPQGPQIGLNLIVLPAGGDADRVAGTALTLLTGGPGSASTQAIAGFVEALGETAARFDMVFADQRGTGRSAPLRCRRDGPPADGPVTLAEIVPACPDGVEGPHDPVHFTTTAAAHDLDRVRAALGHDSLTIVARSYGTRLAQDYARRYPDRTRALLLKGVVPPQGHLTDDLAGEAERMLRAVFAACAAQPACAARYPELDALWSRALDTIGEAVTGTAALSEGGPQREVRASRGLALSALRARLYSVDAAAGLPRRIEALARGETGGFLQEVIAYRSGLDALLADGMYLATTCPEDIAFVDPARARAAAAGSFLGSYRVDVQQAACEGWPTVRLEPDFKLPLTAAVPILALNGALDPATPPEWAEAAVSQAPDARLVLVANRSHALVDDAAGCLRTIERDFLLNADPHAIDAACAAQLEFPAFETAPQGAP